MLGSLHPQLRSAVPSVHGVGQVKILNPYNFGCMTASDSVFDSRGWVFRVDISDEDIATV